MQKYKIRQNPHRNCENFSHISHITQTSKFQSQSCLHLHTFTYVNTPTIYVTPYEQSTDVNLV